MNNKTTVEKTITVQVPENQRTVEVRMEIESNCACTQHPSQRAGSYVDSEPPARA